MQNDFYNAGYNDALVKMGGMWGTAAKAIGSGLSHVGGWLKGLRAPAAAAAPAAAPAAAAPVGMIGGITRGLNNSFTNFAANPGQTLQQGFANAGKSLVGFGNANTTSGVLGRGALGYGAYRGASGLTRT
jgi:hypothetical protein